MTRFAANIGLVGALAVVLGHVVAAQLHGANPVVDPISALSRGSGGIWHTAGLMAFAIAHLAVAYALRDLDAGWLWRFGRALLVVAGIGVVGVALYFANADPARLVGARANDPLSVVASVIGVSMGALQRGWWRVLRPMALVNAVCFAVWLLLIPLILLVTDAWLGGYERLVGATFVTWIAASAIAARTLATPR